MIHENSAETAWKRPFLIMWLAQFVGMSAITGVVSFLPLYVTQLGVTDPSSLGLWAGILMGATSFCAALSNPYWGNLADRKGRKQMVERVLFVFGAIMIAMSFVTSAWQLLLLRIFQGLGGIIADSFGYRLPFVVFGCLCFATLLIIRFAVQENFTPIARSAQASVKDTLHYLWSITDIRVMLVILFLAQFAMQSIGPILPIYIQGMVKGTNTLASISGTIIAIGGITSAFASASMGFVCKYVSHKRILAAASLLCAISFLGQLAAANVITLGVLRALNGFCIGMMIPSANTIVTYLIPETKRGAAYGVTNGATLMGNVLGPLCAGFFSISFGITSIFYFTSLLFLAVFGLLIYEHKKAVSYTAA